MFRTVTFRLTGWYVLLFTAFSVAVFILVDLRLSSDLRKRENEDLLENAMEIETACQTLDLEQLKTVFKHEAESDGITRVFYLLLSPDFEELASSDLSVWHGINFKPAELGTLSNQEVFKNLSVPGEESKVRVIYKKTSDGKIIQIGTSIEEDEELIANFHKIFGVAILLMLLSGSLLGLLITRRAMSGVERVTQTAVRIGKGDLTHRVPIENEGEEIENLASAFNDMLERIHTIVKELKEVTSNIAHDLRSPITRIRGIAETTITGNQEQEEYQAMAGMIVEECDSLVVMINTMLEIAENDSGIKEFSTDPVDMTGVARNAYELFQPVAEQKGIYLKYENPPDTLITLGDVTRLQRLVANLLDNAIKFTPAGGNVILSSSGTDTQLKISIIDSGIGIENDVLPHIFERFYRADRSRSTPGNGLGLSLARSIARAHGGEITVKSQPGKGSTFTVILPRKYLPI